MASRRCRRSLIKELELEDGSITSHNVVIASKITRFHSELFIEDCPFRPFIHGFDWCPIYRDKAYWLERLSEEEEIHWVVFSLEKDKVPGLDGFTFGFFQIVGIMSSLTSLRCLLNFSKMVKMGFL